MPQDIRFYNRSLIDGLREIYSSSQFLAVCSFLLILFISSVIPLSILWLLQTCFLDISIIPITSPYLKLLLTIWSVAEVGFLIYQAYLYSVIQKHSSTPELASNEREQLITNSLANMKDLRHTLSKWFMDQPLENISRPGLIGWLAFAFYSKHPDQLNENEYEELDKLIAKIEVDYQIKLNDGSVTSNQISHMKHILDPVRIIFRPLVFYFVTDTLLNSILARGVFLWRGYQFGQIGDLSFWTYHQPTCPPEEEEDPIIFFHGIGAGLLMYQPFLARLHRQFSPRRRIILISMRCICMRYPSLQDIPNMSETVSSIKLIFQHYQMKKAIFIGHSYGTACLSWIVQKCPEYVSRLIFLDPICFMLFEPYVIYNFVYRMPYKLGHLYMYYFVCRELGISHVISRHFWWTQNNLFLEQIPKEGNAMVPTYVLLSGRDCIVNVHLVKDYLAKHQVEYHWAPTSSHGGYMHDRPSWEQICRWISAEQ